MFIKILYAASFSTFLVLPLLYKCKWRAIRYFYYRMAGQYELRNMYSKMIMLFLIWFHFLYLNLTGNHYDLLPSTIICFTMFSHNYSERLFYFLQNGRTLSAAMLVTLTCLFIPHFLPLGYTFGTLMSGAVFYPSKQLRKKMDDCGWHAQMRGNDCRELPEWYFKWEKMERDVHVTPKDVLRGLARKWKKWTCRNSKTCSKAKSRSEDSNKCDNAPRSSRCK